MRMSCASDGRFARRLVVLSAGLRCRPRRLLRDLNRRGFTFAESVIAMTIIALAGAALLTSVAGAVTSCNDSVFQAVGRGLAQQLMDEVAASKFPNSTSTTTASASTTRSFFTTIDDYSGFTEHPPRTKGGDVLGTEQSASAMSYSAMMMASSGVSSTGRPTSLQVPTDFMNRFTRSVLVERVQPSSNGTWTVTTQSSLYRRVTISVTYSVSADQSRPVAKISRVFASVPASP